MVVVLREQTDRQTDEQTDEQNLIVSLFATSTNRIFSLPKMKTRIFRAQHSLNLKFHRIDDLDVSSVQFGTYYLVFKF